HNRRGDYKLLQEYAPVYGYEVKVVNKMQENHRDISSTYIREEILNGDIQKANRLLGYDYFVEGIILHGKKMGKAVLGIPTINLIPPQEKLLPPNGVYFTKITWNHKEYQGITNVGCKPTIRGNNPIGVETHIFDFSDDIYDQKVKISFLNRVREERKFESLEALIKQMEQDIQSGREYFKEM
ncbi:MAG: riboflavin kinase, partial [Lachnospiraceae bacterium]